jgi:hypothetical protein
MWTIDYYSAEVEKAILNLPSGLLARYLRLADQWQEFGANLGMPHTRAKGDGQRRDRPGILLYTDRTQNYRVAFVR